MTTPITNEELRAKLADPAFSQGPPADVWAVINEFLPRVNDADELELAHDIFNHAREQYESDPSFHSAIDGLVSMLVGAITQLTPMVQNGQLTLVQSHGLIGALMSNLGLINIADRCELRMSDMIDNFPEEEL